jgi:hypothetical protein
MAEGIRFYCKQQVIATQAVKMIVELIDSRFSREDWDGVMTELIPCSRTPNIEDPSGEGTANIEKALIFGQGGIWTRSTSEFSLNMTKKELSVISEAFKNKAFETLKASEDYVISNGISERTDKRGYKTHLVSALAKWK